jgi:menaquinone-specific isochorismate synthase
MTIPRRLARTRPLPDGVDPAALGDHGGLVFAHPGRRLAGWGVEATVTIDRRRPADAAGTVDAYFATIDRDDEVGAPGCGPIAFGALPFRTDRPGRLVVPSLVLGRSADGEAWMTSITVADEAVEPEVLLERALSSHDGDPHRDPTAYRVVAERPADDWCRAVEKATEELRGGTHRKVVLARAVRIEADDRIDPGAVVKRLAAAYPSCFVFSMEGFVGASPELLVARIDDTVRCHPMAGTTPRSADPAVDEALGRALLESSKDREEHQITIDMVYDTLLPWCSYLDWEPEPQLVALANVQHLATRMEGRLSEPAASAVELMAALHPTPAVGGHPTGEALEMMDRLEELDRGSYGGPVGWIDGAGNGEWAVGIRAAHLEGNVARCFAGVGVVADSDPAAELAETRAKLQPLLDAVIRP